MNDPIDANQLTSAEIAMFASLAPDLSTSDQLTKQRTLRALHAQGLLLSRAEYLPRRGLRIGFGIAAALILFFSGAFVGKQAARQSIQASSPSLEVQQAGSAYVNALMRLSHSQAIDRSTNLVAELEAGTATLRAAAATLALITPQDPVVQRIQSSLDAAVDSRALGSRPSTDSSVIWF
jgi:hypothetical protein